MKAVEYMAQKKRARALRAVRRDSVAADVMRHAQRVTAQRDAALHSVTQAYEAGAEDMRIRCLSVPGLTEEQCAAITAIPAVPDDGESIAPGGSGAPGA